MTPSVVDVDQLNLDLERARRLVETIELAMGDSIDGHPDLFGQLEALCHAIHDRLNAASGLIESAPRAPREAAALIDPEWYGGEAEPD